MTERQSRARSSRPDSRAAILVVARTEGPGETDRQRPQPYLIRLAPLLLRTVRVWLVPLPEREYME